MLRTLAVTLLLLTFATPARAEPAEASAATWQRAVGLLQYLSSDYPAAVTSRSASELAEQRGLVQEAEQTLSELGPRGEPFRAPLRAVAARVALGTDPDGVARDCRALVDALAQAGGLRRGPRTTPDLLQGTRLYQASCAACHAVDGSGQTAVATGLEPRPADLRSAEKMDPYTPYRAFNILALGVEGTAMPAFPTFSEDERWAVAFYVMTLREPACTHKPPRAELEFLANATDAELAEKYGAAEVSCLRRVLPAADEDEALAATLASINRARRLGAAGDFAGAPG